MAIGLVVAIAIAWQLWRTHAQNAITYQTAPLERGTVQASVTATGSVNAVVDVQVGSQVSGNIKALYADFNTKVTKGSTGRSDRSRRLPDPGGSGASVTKFRAVRSCHGGSTGSEGKLGSFGDDGRGKKCGLGDGEGPRQLQ